MGVTGKSNITDFNEYKLSRERSISKKKVVHGSFDSDYGYNPANVQHDMQMIKILTRGKKNISSQLAQDIYYKIKVEKIEFYSEIGMQFYDKVINSLTDIQVRNINNTILKKKQKEIKRKKILSINRKIIISLFVIQLLGSILFLNWNLIMDIRTNLMAHQLESKISVSDNFEKPVNLITAINTNLDEDGVTAEDINKVVESGEKEEYSILKKFELLHNENQDFSGWLTIDGTKINYPVMSRENDNNYYLDKNFAQDYDKNGLLIMDYRCNSIDNTLKNTIIYGHNMRTGVMFGTLKNYKDRAYCESHPVIKFDSLYEEGEYKVIAAMLSEVAYEDEEVFRYYDAIDISSEEAFYEFKNNIKENAIYYYDELEYGDSCLTLSTCDNYKEDGRFVVIARKVDTN